MIAQCELEHRGFSRAEAEAAWKQTAMPRQKGGTLQVNCIRLQGQTARKQTPLVCDTILLTLSR